MRKIYMQVFAFMIMAVSQLLFLEVAHATDIYNISSFKITAKDSFINRSKYGLLNIDINLGEQGSKRISLSPGKSYTLVDINSPINIQNPSIKVFYSGQPIMNRVIGGGGSEKEDTSGSRYQLPELVIEWEAYKFISYASTVPNSSVLTLHNSVKASDTIALPNGSINWSTCKTVGAAYCPSRYAAENQEIRTLCDTSSEFLAKWALCKKIFAEFDSYNKTKPSYLPVIVYSIRAGGVGNTGPECRECSNNNNLNDDLTPPKL